MVRFQHYRSGSLYGIQYEFERAGDVVPAHAHDASSAHNIVCMLGAVHLVFGDSENRRILAGEVLDFDWTRRHSIVADCPATILNLFIHGIPPGYDQLGATELKGVLG